MAKAIHVKDWQKIEPSTLFTYAGRAWAGYSESIFHNPFHLRDYDGDRDACILDFIVYWYAPEQKWLRNAAMQLGPNAVLGCWCHPLLCHCDIMAGYMNWKFSTDWLF